MSQVLSTRTGIIGLFASLMVATVLIGLLTHEHFADRVEARLQENLRVIVLAKKSQLENFLQERRGDMDILTRLAPVWQQLQKTGGPLQASEVGQRLNQQLLDFATVYGYRDLRLLDSSLNTLGARSVHPPSREQTSVIQQVLATGVSSLVGFHVDWDGERVFGLIAPVFGNGQPGGAPIGVIYAEMAVTNKLESVITSWPGKSPSAEIFLIESDGDEVVYATRPKFATDNHSKGFFRRSKSANELSTRILRAPDNAVIAGIDYRGVETIGAGVAIAGTPWFLVAKIDHDEANEDVQWLGWTVFLLGVALLILLSAGARLLWRLRAAESEATRMALASSESRFAQLLAATPIPIQIHDRTTLEIRLINKAHETAFGYQLEDIQTVDQWFEQAYADSELARKMRDLWVRNVEEMAAEGLGAVRSSPELALRCKDGSTRIVKGYGTVVGDDIIALWQDLTEIKHATQALERDQKRFRGMIEQSLAGIYVTQNERIVYANPRLCEMIGWMESELIGHNSLDIFGNIPDSREKILFGRAQIAAGARSVSQDYAIRTRDGREIVLGSHASEVIWDGHPANVIFCQDVSEALEEKKKIAAHLKQLETSMQGTLQAVATMVELRDPYTAGHERRVGLLAADIAREMGWAEDQCESLKLIGLVHDIGKIAVPAELLTKPTRLTKLEFDMIKVHAEKGYEILKDVPFPLPVAEIIREHHERLDGSGYPRGLRGDQILPEARILAVADVLESMSSHRPYRPALGIEVAVREIETHRGVWFDEQAVDAVLRLVREKSYQLPA